MPVRMKRYHETLFGEVDPFSGALTVSIVKLKGLPA